MFTSTPYDMHHRLPDLPENTDWPRLVDGYRHMTLIRTFDKKAVNLQRTGKLRKSLAHRKSGYHVLRGALRPRPFVTVLTPLSAL